MKFVNVEPYGDWIQMILWGAPDNLTKVSVDMLKDAPSTESTKNVSNIKSTTMTPKVNSSTISTTMKPQENHDAKIEKTVNTTSNDIKEMPKNVTSKDSVTTLHPQLKTTVDSIRNNSASSTTLAPLKNHSEIENSTTTVRKKDSKTTPSTTASTTSHSTSTKSNVDEVSVTKSSTSSPKLFTQDERIAKALDFNSTTPKISPVLENVFTNKSVTNNETPLNISMNETDKNSFASNSTVENQALLAQISLPPWMIIGCVFVVCLVVLFLIFCILGRGKPELH